MKKRVLFIEDEPDQVRVTDLRLRLKGHRTSIAETRQAAASALRNEPFDVVVVDVRMPEAADSSLELEGGLETVEQLRQGKYGEINRETPFIILTGQRYALDPRKVEDLGGCLGIEKKLTQYKTIALIEGESEEEDE